MSCGARPIREILFRQTDLSNLDWALGRYEKSLDEALEALGLEPTSGNNYENLAWAYFLLNRLEEAPIDDRSGGRESSTLQTCI